MPQSLIMEYDSESSCDGRIKDLNILNSSKTQPEFYPRSDRILRASVATSWQCVDVVDSGAKPRPNIANKSLSAQVMEYYHKYSQSSNLEQFFSLPASSNYYNLYKPSTKLVEDNSDCISDNYSLKIPKERRRWVRPPLVGQSTVNVDRSTVTLESKLVWPDSKVEDKSESQEFEKKSSPTSSVASVKPLEWDSLADVGYSNFNPQKTVDKKLSTIERMVLHTGCSTALRLDPEGTEPVNSQNKQTIKSLLKPQANSTFLSSKGLSESESEREITPVVKRHYQKSDTNDKSEKTSTLYKTANSLPKHSSIKTTPREPLLKKSPSMNLLKASGSQVSLKRSQSELNICAKDKYKILPRLIFNSTSSIATVVNKVTCDKVIQTSEQVVRRNVQSESVGIQVSVPEDENMARQSKRPQSILKNSNNSYRGRSKSQSRCNEDEEAKRRGKSKKAYQSSATSVDSVPSTSRPDENVTGRANSFEYFPGHVYKCAQEEKTSSQMSSRVSSVETGNSHSTMPNTSSSLEEKLWGTSDSLLCDLEKSLKILQSLVNANKCDKQTRERFIHHVVNRLVSANYTDDKLEENSNSNSKETSLWNSEDDKKKVYRQKKTTTDSSEDWRPQRKKEVCKKDKQKKKIAAESSSDKFDRNTDRTETDGRKARMGLRADDCYQKSESSDCFVPPRGYGKMSKSERKDSTSLSITNQESELLEEIEDKSQSTINSNNNENDWESPFQTERDYEGKENSETESERAKLINYAEMEKRNQLVWITNEISHLLNLKRLLEKPKKVSPTKSSTSKHKDDKSPAKTPAKKESTKNKKRTVSDNSFESRLHKQWSSHCNLSTCDPISHNSFSTVKCIRKRNSYSQTASNINYADSKSGAEIISAQKVSTRIVKITSSSSQTSPCKSNKVNTASQTQTYSQMVDDLKTCLKTCTCLQCENKRSIMSLPSEENCLKECICNEQLKLKEAKNQMNSKLNMQKSVQKLCCHCKVQEKVSDRVCKCVPSSSTGSSNCDYDQIVTVNCHYCSSCGLSYRNERTCKCRVVMPKPIAYEITFDEEKKQNDNCRVKSNDKRLELNEPVVGSCRNAPGSSGRCHCNSDDEEKEKEDYEGKETLQEYLQSNNPKFLINTETRQKYISEMSELRKIKKEKRKQLFAMTSTSGVVKSLKTQKIKKHSRKDFSKEKLKALSRQRYLSLNEVRAKRKQKEKEEALRHNKLMAHLFCKKLQQKVLRGQVDLSQSTSVISNF